MKLLSWNVNGIRACLKKGFLDFLNQEKPDILGLQEIKISQKDIAKQEFDFKNYQEFYNSAQRPGYSGTAILAKNNISNLKIKNGLDILDFDKEGRVQALELEKFYFVNAYFPNANHELSRLAYKENFNQAFLAYIKKLDKKKPVIACGDFNVAHHEIDLKNPKQNEQNAGFTQEERIWMDKFLKSGFSDGFRILNPDKIQYSWWSYRFRARERNIGWRIDYFLASDRILKNIKKAFILDKILGSDHAPAGIEIEF